jgi:hypothetical protein
MWKRPGMPLGDLVAAHWNEIVDQIQSQSQRNTYIPLTVVRSSMHRLTMQDTERLRRQRLEWRRRHGGGEVLFLALSGFLRVWKRAMLTALFVSYVLLLGYMGVVNAN